MAVSAVAITIDGVMQKRVSSSPITTGIQLYHGLAETFSVHLLTDQREKEMSYWLNINKLNKHAGVTFSDNILETYSSSHRRAAQLAKLRTTGYVLDLVIEPDPSVAAHLLAGGYTVCAFLSASYADPSWRPDWDGEERGWKRLEQEASRQAELRAMDFRLNNMDNE
jgi:hypothetical protein